MNRTRISTHALVTAYFYLKRLKRMHPRCKGSRGSGHRLFLAATILAAKYMYDDTFDNTAWATVSSGLFDLEHVNHMERELLQFLDFKLFILSEEWCQFYEALHNHIYPVSSTLNMAQLTNMSYQPNIFGPKQWLDDREKPSQIPNIIPHKAWTDQRYDERMRL